MTALSHRISTARALRRCTMVGQDIVVEGPLYVHNLGRISLGDGVMLRATPVMSHLVCGPLGDLRIGHRTQIGHGASIASHHSIRIGEDVRIGAFVTLIDTDFHAADDHAAEGATGMIEIGDGARLGPRVTVLHGSVIGAGAIIEAGSVVKGQVAAGARLRGNLARRVVPDDLHFGDVALGAAAVPGVVAYTFGLPLPPAAGTHRDDIAQWDSLGTLNLLLSLEQTFGVTLAEDSIATARTVADLMEIVRKALAASA